MTPDEIAWTSSCASATSVWRFLLDADRTIVGCHIGNCAGTTNARLWSFIENARSSASSRRTIAR